MIRLVASHPEWVLGFEDETWWSRLTPPTVHTWTDQEALRLVEQTRSKEDSDPKALAGYGLLVRGGALLEQTWLRFVAERPVSAVTIQFLEGCCGKRHALGKQALVLIWNNATWHRSQAVRDWIHQHNQQVKCNHAGIRLLVCPLPTKSPWLNPIEPKWVHGKRRVIEPEHLLTAHELAKRVYATFGCPEEQLDVIRNKFWAIAAMVAGGV